MFPLQADSDNYALTEGIDWDTAPEDQSVRLTVS